MVKRKYIYERACWPELKWDGARLADAAAQVHGRRGVLFGKLQALGFSVQNALLLSAVTGEIVTSSKIEGENLDMEGVRSSVARRLGIETAGAGVHADHYTEGVVQMALDASQNYGEPLTDERLFGWHAALFPTGRSGNHRIVTGAYRKAEMEIVSGAMGKERVHYRAPAPERVGAEMNRLLGWIESDVQMDPFLKAGLAHLRFEAIHPFDDGNGRIGRAIADLMLARAEGSAERYYSLSSQMLAERREYYAALEEAQSGTGDVTDWLLWFAGCVARAMEASEGSLDAAIEKARLFDAWRHIPMNERQLTMVNMLLDGFEGKLRTSKWAKIAKCSQDTALRDIEDLMAKGVLRKEAAGGRSTAYELAR